MVAKVANISPCVNHVFSQSCVSRVSETLSHDGCRYICIHYAFPPVNVFSISVWHLNSPHRFSSLQHTLGQRERERLVSDAEQDHKLIWIQSAAEIRSGEYSHHRLSFLWQVSPDGGSYSQHTQVSAVEHYISGNAKAERVHFKGDVKSGAWRVLPQQRR